MKLDEPWNSSAKLLEVTSESVSVASSIVEFFLRIPHEIPSLFIPWFPGRLWVVLSATCSLSSRHNVSLSSSLNVAYSPGSTWM